MGGLAWRAWAIAGRAETSAAQTRKNATAARGKRAVMANLPGDEGTVASHFADESSIIGCGKWETCAYIRRVRAAEKARTDEANSATGSGTSQRGGMKEHEDGNERGIPDFNFLQRDW